MALSNATRSAGRADAVRAAPRPFWEPAYAAALALLDALLITVACGVSVAVNFGGKVPTFHASTAGSPGVVSYSQFLAIIPVTWLAILAASQAYEARFLGVGSDEFKRVFNASTRFVALLGLGAFAFKAQVARGFVAVVVPTGVVLLLVGRYAARKVLHQLRRNHRCLHRVVLVGSPAEVVVLAEQMLREPYAGLDVVAVVLPGYPDQELMIEDRRLPNIGPACDVAAHLASVGADTVAIAGSSAMSAQELRQLSWDLERTGSDLLVAPAITDVTGPRIHIRPVAGLPLLHVESPTFGGLPTLVKRVIDVVGALALLVLFSLPLLVIALLIRLEGPVFFRQVRVGRDGTRFRIWKFRSMQVGAEELRAGLPNMHHGPAFKMVGDPRITKVGRFLRRTSLDELPQLLNVLSGTMSLVGPRPPLPSEVDYYEQHVHRRLLVKPGMTGLWQVSGRADLSWEESVRIDLYYVENWSVALDAQILWKTLFALLRPRGAY